jgi:hypothetical protein
MKSLLTVTALVEGFTGLALAIVPSLVVSILLGTNLIDSNAFIIARLAGAALITIGIACWLSRNHTQYSIMVKAMLGYNIFSIVLLLYTALVEKISDPGLWPAIMIHFGLLIWCVSSFRKPVN